jgi:predicted lipid-binding transport protein (Tim44 family)
MRSLVLAIALVFASTATLPLVAEARRIGGGGAVGMQRSVPPRAAPEALPARPAAPTAQPAPAPTAAAAPAVAPRRSWLGPIAGLAAGLGIAALMSHLGFGAEFGNIVMLMLLGIAAIVAIRFVMRRFASAPSAPDLRFAGAGPSLASPAGGSFGATGGGFGAASATGAMPVAPVAGSAPASHLPADFDAPAFERVAKMIFIRLQAANDSGDLGDLRAFTTPEMFAHLKLDLQERGAAAQQTDVERVDAEVLDVARDADRQIVSVRFHGLIREEPRTPAEPFDEVWHLVKPADGSREWAIAGIQPTTPALANAA